jgi:hypothetical protein
MLLTRSVGYMKSSKTKQQSFSSGQHHTPFNKSSRWNWIAYLKIIILQLPQAEIIRQFKRL